MLFELFDNPLFTGRRFCIVSVFAAPLKLDDEGLNLSKLYLEIREDPGDLDITVTVLPCISIGTRQARNTRRSFLAVWACSTWSSRQANFAIITILPINTRSSWWAPPTRQTW